MFLAAMTNLGSADDIEKASDVLDETKLQEKELKESLTIWHNLLMVAMTIACAFFGVYLAVDAVGANNDSFLPRVLIVAWVIAGVSLVACLFAEIFINISRDPKAKI